MAALLLLVGLGLLPPPGGLPHPRLHRAHRTHSSLWYGFVLAALLPMYCFIGWEGAADLAEETNDPRAVTPYAMMRANLVSMGASVLMIVGFLIAIPLQRGRICWASRRTRSSTSSRATSASIAADVLQVVVFLAIFSCVLANMVVATRSDLRALARQDAARARRVLGARQHDHPHPDRLDRAGRGGGHRHQPALGRHRRERRVDLQCGLLLHLPAHGRAAPSTPTSRTGCPAMRAGDFTLGRWFLPVAVSRSRVHDRRRRDRSCPAGGPRRRPLPARRRGRRRCSGTCSTCGPAWWPAPSASTAMPTADADSSPSQLPPAEPTTSAHDSGRRHR